MDREQIHFETKDTTNTDNYKINRLKMGYNAKRHCYQTPDTESGGISFKLTLNVLTSIYLEFVLLESLDSEMCVEGVKPCQMNLWVNGNRVVTNWVVKKNDPDSNSNVPIYKLSFIPREYLKKGENRIILFKPSGQEPLLLKAALAMPVEPIAEIGTNNWMGAIPDCKLLGDVNLPGTHNSAAINWMNPFKFLWGCQRKSIREQLERGIRVLDVRLQVAEVKKDHFSFTCCHGNNGLKLDLHLYQSFESMLEECEDFLASSPSEVIVMTIKVDDWSDLSTSIKTSKVLPQLKKLLLRFSAISLVDQNPQLIDARGKIVFYNRIEKIYSTIGTPVYWSDNAKPGYDEYEAKRVEPSTKKSGVKLFVQDVSTFSNTEALFASTKKFNLVVDAYGEKRDGELLLNFTSGASGIKGMELTGVYPNKRMLDLFGARINMPRKIGWVMLDFALVPYVVQYSYTEKGEVRLTDFIIDSNFGYRAFCNRTFIVKASALEL